ncbi:hypothetical protein [Streptomyces sp. NPDC050504]|uniref:hypothetical protein n=1 Tax=Streptomyces sp. NPDC050504 TaxID=3365618 RepID=UPI00378A55EF
MHLPGALSAALDFTAGVLALVCLTASVVWGLLATDRLLLSSRQRLVAQAVHRAAATASLGFLLLHAAVKIALDHVSPLGALVPFGLGFDGTRGLIGLGSLAALLMFGTAATGALRGAFTASGRGQAPGRAPGRLAAHWRSLHALAYPAWCAALLHGLYAGRPAAPWVVALYGLALCTVVGALSLRLLPPPAKERVRAYVRKHVNTRLTPLGAPPPGTAPPSASVTPPCTRPPLPRNGAAPLPPNPTPLPGNPAFPGDPSSPGDRP